jgi:DNA-binding transcriptional LysR family regulator
VSINDFDLNLLKIFVAVAENGGFTNAAKKLFVKQPSVSRSIARLEDEVGPLFLRTKRRVQLTSRGTDLLVLAKNILAAGIDFLDVAKNKEAELSGTIRFAAESPISSLFIPEVIQRVAKEHPRLWPMMFSGITEDVMRRIKDRDIEFGFFFYEANRVAGLDYREIVQCEYRVVAAPTIDAEGTNSFIGSREINQSGTASLPTFSKLKKINKALRIKYSANDLNACRELILRGLGIGLLPEAMVRSDLQKKNLKVIYPNLKLSFPIWFVKRQGYPLSLEGQRMASLLVDVVSRF